MVRPGELQDLGVGRCLERHGQQPARRAREPPGTAGVALERQIDARHLHRPRARLDQQHPAHATARLAGVAVAEDHGREPGEALGDRPRRVLARLFVRADGPGLRVAPEAAVDRDERHVRLLGLERLERAPHALHRREPRQAADVLRLLPLRNRRGGDADDRDLDAGHGLQQVGSEGRQRGAGLGVGRQPREAGFVAGRSQALRAEVEVVVADDHGVVADAVHRQHHRLRRARSARWPLGLVNTRERRALDRVAAVEEQHVRRLAPDLGDQGRSRRQAARGGLLREVVVGVDEAVGVGRGEHGDGRSLQDGCGRCDRGRRERRGSGLRGQDEQKGREPHAPATIAPLRAGSCRLLCPDRVAGPIRRRRWSSLRRSPSGSA